MNRKFDWFNALAILTVGLGFIWILIVLGKSPIGLVLGAEPAKPAWNVRVSLPEPGYRQADGSLLGFTKFKGTRIIWGSCDAKGYPLEGGGEVTVRSWQFFGEVKIPAGRDVCIVAVVIGLDGMPMGMSTPVRYSTKGTRPAAPWLKVETNA